eukprot:TRINITY_DN2771_c1_g3_i1.p1 TRINITY_DN2771_c1_g3~~TRINITY_DN2771_c1_g3_i1.p1  ORF type:complete len:978 (+),score=333.39 TRINITY_DN2771_c1_g3_i1:163-3096(+)
MTSLTMWKNLLKPLGGFTKANSGVGKENFATNSLSGEGNEGEEQVPLTDDQIIATLPLEMFQENVDVVELIFRSIPPDYDPTTTTSLSSPSISSTDPNAQKKKYKAQVDPSMLLDEKYVELQRKDKERSLDAINSKLSSKVMNNYNSFVQGMTQIHELGVDLQTSADVCKEGRKSLLNAKEELIQRVLVILAKNKKKQRYVQIMKQLMEVKRVITAENQFKEVLLSGDYPKAMDLCLECKNLINNCKHFKCVDQMTVNLTQNLKTLEKKMGGGLTEICRNFDANSYEKILIGFRMSGQSHRVLESSKKAYLETINSNTKDVLFSHVMMSIDNASNGEDLKKMHFPALCGMMKSGDHFLMCLNTILEVLCDLMYSQWSAIQWHEKYQSLHPAPPSNEDPSDEQGEISRFFWEIGTGLVEYKKGFWELMQRKVADILGAPAVKQFKIDDFLKVLDSVYKFMDIGEQFSCSESHNLRTAIKIISKSYFESFHKQRIEDLSAMLENEMWQKVPLQKDFSIKEMKELKLFRNPPKIGETSRYRRANNPINFANGNQKNSNIQVFIQFKTLGNPFSRQYKGTNQETYHEESSDDDENDELKVDEVEEEQTNKLKPAKNVVGETSGPIITTSTVNVARFFGKYAHMMKILEPICFEIFSGLVQIFEFYCYTVLVTFGSNNIDSDENPMVISAKLRNAITTWKKAFVAPGEPVDPALGRKVVRIPQVNPILPINDPNSLYCLGERVVAVQSTLFLCDALQYLKPHLQTYLPVSYDNHFLHLFNEIDVIPEFTRYMYRNLAIKSIKWEEIVQQIANTNFFVKDFENVLDSNPYVGRIVKEWQNFDVKFKYINKTAGIPKKVQEEIYLQLSKVTMEQIVEGYSRVKKCDQPGRSLMSLDVTTLETLLRKYLDHPRTEFAMNYIKAYFEEEKNILNWCKEHPEYSLRQILSVINVGVGNTMARKNRITLETNLTQLEAMKRKLASEGL